MALRRYRQCDGLPPEEVARRVAVNVEKRLHETVNSLKYERNVLEALLLERFGVTIRDVLNRATVDEQNRMEANRRAIAWRSEHIQRLKQFGTCEVCGICRHEVQGLSDLRRHVPENGWVA